MRGRDLVMWPEGQWEALKKIAWEGDKHTDTQTDMSTLWPTRPRRPSWWKDIKKQMVSMIKILDYIIKNLLCFTIHIYTCHVNIIHPSIKLIIADITNSWNYDYIKCECPEQPSMTFHIARSLMEDKLCNNFPPRYIHPTSMKTHPFIVLKRYLIYSDIT